MKKIICILLAVVLTLSIVPGCGKNRVKDPEKPTSGSGTPTGTPAVKGDILAYQQTFLEDLVRERTAEDRVRTADYTVDDGKLETLIALLDAAVGASETQELLGLDLNKLVDDVFAKVFCDATVNLILQMLMPMVEREFQKVWVTIPGELEIPDVPTGMPVVKKANVVTQIQLDDIETALTAIDFYIFPKTLANLLPAKYDQAKAKLAQATTPSAYDAATDTLTTAWEDAVLLNDEGKLDLTWGVTDRESFVDAVCAALAGAEPLLLALLSNKTCHQVGDIGVGTGNAYVLGGVLELDLTVNRIELVFDASETAGYNNTLAPIFEMFGLTPPDGNTFGSVREFVEQGLLAPIDELLDTLLASPVYTLLGVLPHLAYAVEAGFVIPLLSMLKTVINYSANAYYTAQIAGDGVLNDAYHNAEPINIVVGEMLDLNELGLDVSSLNGLLGSLGAKLGVTLPPIDAATLATLGELTWHDSKRTDHVYKDAEPGKAARIEGNRADVALFLLRYILGALKDRELIGKVLALVDENLQLPDTVYTITDGIAANPDGAIAAVTELLLPQAYNAPAGVTWRAFTPGPCKAAALYTDYWTTAKAGYMADHLATFLDGLLQASDMEIAGISANSLPELVDGIAGLICAPDTLNKVAGLIADKLGGIALPEKIASLLYKKTGIDLNYWKNYRASFAAGDRAAFKQGVIDLVYPIRSLLDYALMGKDFTVTLTDVPSATVIDLVSLKGYNAYSSGIVPLMEALGVSSPPTAAGLNYSSMSLISYIVDTVFTVVDSLKIDPISELMTMLPNLLLFLRSGCLTDVVNNALYVLDVLLETLRPVYKVDLNALLDFDVRFTSTDPVTLVCGLAKKVLKEKLGVNVQLDFTTESLYNDLNSWTTESYTSANGQTGLRVNAASINKNDILTVIYDYLLKEILFSENTPAYLQFAKEQLGLSDFIINYLTNVAPAIKSADETYPGAGKALVFWVFFAGDSLVGAVNGGASNVFSIIAALMGSGTAEARSFAAGELTKDVRNEGFANVLVSVLKPLFS